MLTYFLPAVLDTAGYTEEVTKANINLGYACFQFVFALTGAAFVDRIGRQRAAVLSDVFSGLSVAAVPLIAATVGLGLGWLVALAFVGAVFDPPGFAAREAMLNLAEVHHLPVENLLTPDYLRRLMWAPPATREPAELAEAVRAQLASYGARPWQAGLVTGALVGAILGAERD